MGVTEAHPGLDGGKSEVIGDMSWRLLTFSEVEPSEREVDDCRVLLFDKDILGEAFEVQDDVWR